MDSGSQKPLERKEVTPIPKGQLRPWRCKKDDPECTRTEPCNSCKGKRSRTSGLRKQRLAKKALGVPSSRFAPTDGNEENWKHFFRLEVKSGAQVGPIATRYLPAEAQSEKNRALGDNRPFAMVAMPKQWGSRGLVILRIEDFRNLCDLALPVLESGSSLDRSRHTEPALPVEDQSH